MQRSRMQHLLLPSFLGLLIFAFASGGAWAQKPADPGYKTDWMRPYDAAEKAKKSRYGILYYFPPNDGEKEHAIFSTEEMSVQSRTSPMIKVGPGHAELRTKYDVPKKYPTIVITDWFGNEMAKFAARSLTDKKFKFEAIRGEIKKALPYVEAQEARIGKKLTKAQKHFDKKKWSSAIKELSGVKDMSGYDNAEKAKDLYDLVIEEGQAKLEDLTSKPLKDKADRIKQLKKIARDFKGSEVEEEAKEKIAELK